MYFLLDKTDNTDLCGVYPNNDPTKAHDHLKARYNFVSVDDYLKDCNTDEDRINKVLNAAKLYYENYFDNDDITSNYR